MDDSPLKFLAVLAVLAVWRFWRFGHEFAFVLFCQPDQSVIIATSS